MSIRYEVNSNEFNKIPGSPLAYWASKAIFEIFTCNPNVGSLSEVKIGMGTGKNDLFVRNWWEISYKDIDFSLTKYSDLDSSYGKYFPYNKGGEFRPWYGNQQEVLWFDKNGRELMFSLSGHRENGGKDFYFKDGITWSFISSTNLGMRYIPTGFLFDVAGSTLFSTGNISNEYILALFSSNSAKTILKMLNPTLNYQAGNIKSLPVIIADRENIEKIASNNINNSKEDWDSFETSWNFKKHPLV